MFCKHDWKMLSETVTKSKFESAANSIDNMKSTSTKARIPHQMCCADRKVIQIVTCVKCGKLKKFVENI
jgi:hypothetical protein